MRGEAETIPDNMRSGGLRLWQSVQFTGATDKEGKGKLRAVHTGTSLATADFAQYADAEDIQFRFTFAGTSSWQV